MMSSGRMCNWYLAAPIIDRNLQHKLHFCEKEIDQMYHILRFNNTLASG